MTRDLRYSSECPSIFSHKHLISLLAIAAAFVALGTSPTLAQPCHIPDNGTGTIDLPPAGCSYLSPSEVHLIINGLPPGTTIRLDPIHRDFFGISRSPGGSLGGEVEMFQSFLGFQMTGTGALAGFSRTAALNNVQVETHTAPRTPGAPVQSFDTDMFRMQGQLPPVDPDFSLLRITGGTVFGMPSPGHTTLTRLPGGDFNVDSFFDITYQIEFVGRPGGTLGGMSGSTTATIRMVTGVPGGNQFPPAGTDLSPTTGIFHVDATGIGPVQTSVSGQTLLQWQNPQTDPNTGQRMVQTELLSMDLSGSNASLGSLNIRAGSQHGLPQTLGSVTPLGAGSDFPALATFDVFFEVEVQGVATLRNQQPLVMQADITEIPPRAVGLRNTGPILITDILNPTHVDVLRTAQHWMCPPPFPPPGVPCPVPCNRSPFPVCSPGDCPGTCSLGGTTCRSNADCAVGDSCVGVGQCVPNAATGACGCVPGFPPAGSDLSPTVGSLRVDVFGVGPVDASLSGQTLLQWQNPQIGPTGQRTVQTEMLSLDLTGSHPSIGNLHVTAGSQQGLQPTLGSVVPLGPGSDFPATAFFDVFFDVEVQGVATLRNDQPLVMQAEITEIPPRNIGLRNAAPVQITDIVNPQHIDTIQTAQHWMCPPPFPPAGVPCPVPCNRSPFPVCGPGSCPIVGQQCVPSPAAGLCTCVGSFPPAGTDLSPTVGTFRVDVFGVGPVDTSVSGQTLLQWQDPQIGPTGQVMVQTEMLSLDLSGSHPSIGNLSIQAGSQQGLPATLGSVTPLGPGSDFPALATFDVFFEVVVDEATTLRNSEPLVMQAEITEIPPRSIGLRNAAPVQITDIVNPQHIDTIQTAQHWMCPPPFPPTGVPCPVPCDRNPFPVCSLGSCPPDRPLCVPDAATQSCRCVSPFPPAGFDLSPTTGIFRVDVIGVGETDVKVSGEVLLKWQDPETGPTGQRTVQTEMLSLDLRGSNPSIGNLNITGGSNFGLPPTLGSVVPLGPGSDFPALATFDVFFEVEVQGVATLRNNQPLVMQAEITEIPPRNLGLRNLAPVQITDIADPNHIDTIQTAVHWMCPPPFPPPGVPCPVPCNRTPFPLCSVGGCPIGLQCVPAPLGKCQCVPGFPPAGTDLSPTTGIFHVDATGIGPVQTSVSGQTLLQWQNPQTDPNTGQRMVQTELLSMDLSGSNPSLGSLNIRAGSQHGLPQTLGSVTPLGAGSDFPALATFDVFFEVEVQGVATLRNQQPLVMQADITEIPPRAVGLRNTGPILITDILDPTHVDVLRTAQHWMCPPPFPPPGVPCPVPCNRSPFPVCSPGDCPGTCSLGGTTCRSNADCAVGDSCVGVGQCVPNAATGACGCVPGFPPAGSDLSPTVGSLRVDVFGVGPVDASLSGQTLLQWQNPQIGPTGQRTVQTEMLSLDLTGSHPSIGNLHVTAGSQQGLPPTLGSVVPLGPGSDFPATAFFDVFFDVEVQGVATLRNDQPLVMQAEITEIPPRNIGLRNAAPVQITDIVDPQHIDTIQTAQHWMCPPPFPPPGVPCPVPCNRSPFPVCGAGSCPIAGQQCVPSPAAGLCTCVGPFPPAGTDLSPTVGTFRVDVFGVGPVDTSVSGQTLLQWQDPQIGPTGQVMVQTEMLSLDLSGSHPSIGNLSIQAGSQQGLPATLGSVTPLGPGSDFPALATFDVFFEVVVDGATTLRNDQPLVMQAEITEIPPRSIGLRNAAPVQITDIVDPQHVDTIQTAQHWMCPPPFPPTGVPCPVPCDRNPFPVCSLGSCPPDRPLCVPDAATQFCRCVSPFPPAGFDLSPTTGIFRVDVIGVGETDVKVSGEVLLKWQDPVTGPTGQRTVQTEMLSLDLSGANPSIGNLNITGGSNFGLPPTLGSVTPLGPGADFPALATFDVFFEVEVQGVATLRNNQPLVMQAEITEIPPRNLGLRNLAPVQITDIADPNHIDTIQTAVHWMCPPPFPPPGVPCPVPCNQTPFPLCSLGDCPPGSTCIPAGAGGLCACIAPLPSVAGAVPEQAPGALTLSQASGGQITLNWGASCRSTDTDYAIYEGELGNYYSHGALFCSTGGATTMTFTPTAGSRYYLIVPHQGSVEGSYGTASNSAQLPQGAPACLPRVFGACP